MPTNETALRILGVAFMTVGLVASMARAADSTTQPQPTVVCFGDSITKVGYGDKLGAEVQAKVINSGVSGETTDQAMKRLERDVLAHRPAVVVLLYGTNDMVMDKPEPKVNLERYAANLTAITKAVQEMGGKVVICTVPPIKAEPYFKRHPKANYDRVGGLPKVIADYRAAAMKVGEANKCRVVDLNTILAERPEWMAPDGVHPTEEGRVIIAKAIAPAVTDALSNADGE